jgi:excisionase family DNA binding protein
MEERILLNKREVATALAISVRTVENLIASKRLPVRRIGRRTLVSRVALEAFARRDHRTHEASQSSEGM